ncbi:MAG: aromatic ring-hydroxylating dioxygenase subunit alpha [Sneathiellaceae bacterium]
MDSETLDRLVLDDRAQGSFRVHRQAFVDPAILELERRAVFDRCWLYAGHESEFAAPGDFVTRKIGGRPLILVRDRQGAVRAFLNSCPHRGNLVCREGRGTARVFTCFYHAWSFNLDGGLAGLPGEESYTASFDRAAMGLRPVPRMESYRGLVFVCFDADAVDLATYLGRARERLDWILDFGDQDVEIVQGAQAYSMRANWKLLVENSIDGYHAMATHQRYFRQYLPDLGMDSAAAVMPRHDTQGVELGNGHAVTEKPKLPAPLMTNAKEELAAIRADLERRFGPERTRMIADFDRNLFIFPNLILISTWRTLRTFYPVAPDYMEIDSWALLPRSDSAEMRQKRFQNFIGFLGPAGFGTPDDVSGLEGCQRGFATVKEMPYSDISRGMGRARPTLIDELQMRAFWRRWHALVRGQTGPTDCADRPQDAVAAE